MRVCVRRVVAVFPPAWRLADYFVARYTERLQSFDPFPTYVAGIVCGSVFAALALWAAFRMFRIKIYGP